MIYLLHASKPIGTTGRGAAQHYLGWCKADSFERRMQEHRTGRSKVPVVRAFLRAGARLYLGRLWPEGTRSQEWRLKENGHLDRWCDVCQGRTEGKIVMEAQQCLPL